MDLVGALRVFVSVAEDEHVTRAAERLGMAQPVVSRQLKLLEQQLGIALFRRVGRRVVITDDGRRLTPLARDLIERADRILDLRGAGSTRTSSLRIAVPVAGEVAALAVMIRLASEHGLELTLLEAAEGERRQWLTDGRVDVALLRTPPEQTDFSVPLGFGSADVLGTDGRSASDPDQPVRPLPLESLRKRSGRRTGPVVFVQPEDAGPATLDDLIRAAGRAGLGAEQVQPVETGTSAPVRVVAGHGLLLCSRPEAVRFGLRWRPSGDQLGRRYGVVGSGRPATPLPDGTGRLLRRAYGGRVDRGRTGHPDPDGSPSTPVRAPAGVFG